MTEPIDSNSPEFWNERYKTDATPWALRCIPAALDSFLRSTTSRGAVLIPGCGTDHDVIRAFHAAGFDVTAIDFSPVAVKQTKAAVGSLGVHLIAGDFFQHDFGNTCFDLIYERTFLCALHPSRWREYAQRIARLLTPDGLLAGIFFYGRESDPPPYPIDLARAHEIFGAEFRLGRNKLVTDSLPMFEGQEKWQEWRRIVSADSELYVRKNA